MRAKASVYITNQGITVNNKPVFTDIVFVDNKLPFNKIYKQLGITYPKYHKMDNLSKLGFLGVELLKREIDLSHYGEDRIAQIFQNSYSSLDTDIVHQKSINNKKMASPAVFVYTLPNIVMGEIAIRNKLYGENLFILADKFLPQNWLELSSVQLALGKADAIIGGWIEIFENNFDLRLFLLDNSREEGLCEVK